MSNKLKQFKNLIAMSALAAAASFAHTSKAERIEDVKQCPNGTLIIHKTADEDGEPQIGGVKTPWMFARPDGQSAFANHFTTNATEVVVDRNGSNVYSHVAGEGKVTHFTLSPDGIPSTNGVEYALTNADGSKTNTCEKLLATHNGELYTIDDTTNKEAVVFINRYTNNNERFVLEQSYFPDGCPKRDEYSSLVLYEHAVKMWKQNPWLVNPVGPLKDSSYAFDIDGTLQISILLPSTQLELWQNMSAYEPSDNVSSPIKISVSCPDNQTIIKQNTPSDFLMGLFFSFYIIQGSQGNKRVVKYP